MSAALDNRDYTLIIDRSGSMGETDQPGGKSRWDAAREGTEAVARKIQQLDPDGITLYTFAGTFNKHENVLDDKVKQIFTTEEPNGSTALAEVLEDAFNGYFKRKAQNETKANGEIIVVVTDGAPNDPAKVKRVIIEASKKMDRDEELGVQFVQIGGDDGATKFLKSLDDDLVSQGAKYDIVDTMTAEDLGNMTISEALARAITD